MVPVIETERLRLRPITVDDLDHWAAACADPVVVRHLGGASFSREDTWRRLLATMGSWAMLGYGYWAVERKGEAGMIGHAGFSDFKRDLNPSIAGIPEAGWVFASAAHGQGYALEAVTAALAWADEALKGQETAAIIAPANAPSIRLAEKVGFTRSAETTYKNEPILIFRRPAP